MHVSRSVDRLIHYISWSVSRFRFFFFCLSLLLASIVSRSLGCHSIWLCKDLCRHISNSLDSVLFLFSVVFFSLLFSFFAICLKSVFQQKRKMRRRNDLGICWLHAFFFMKYTGNLGWFLLLLSGNFFLFLMITSQFDSISHLCSSLVCVAINIHRLLRDTYLSDTRSEANKREREKSRALKMGENENEKKKPMRCPYYGLFLLDET